jgi:hypothetical protein
MQIALADITAGQEVRVFTGNFCSYDGVERKDFPITIVFVSTDKKSPDGIPLQRMLVSTDNCQTLFEGLSTMAKGIRFSEYNETFVPGLKSGLKFNSTNGYVTNLNSGYGKSARSLERQDDLALPTHFESLPDVVPLSQKLYQGDTFVLLILTLMGYEGPDGGNLVETFEFPTSDGVIGQDGVVGMNRTADVTAVRNSGGERYEFMMGNTLVQLGDLASLRLADFTIEYGLTKDGRTAKIKPKN